MTTTHSVDAVEAYIDEVRARLVGVPDDERAELLDEITTHVREVAREHGPEHLRERLGSPAQFGDELRASAGYAAPEPEAKPAGAVRRLWGKARDRFQSDRTQEVWQKLEPGWFVVRGVLFGYAVFQVAGVQRELMPRLGNSRVLGVAVLVLGAVASFMLGERRPAVQTKWARRGRIGAEAAIVILGLAFLTEAGKARVMHFDSGNAAYQTDACLRDSAGRPIGNLFAYDPAGQLIPQFFLTDQSGRPIDNLCPDQAQLNQHGPGKTTYTRDANGAPVYNVFPRKQEQLIPNQQTGEATWVPAVPPAVVFPQIAPTTTTTAAPPPQ